MSSNRKFTQHLTAESREMFESCAEQFGIEDFAHRKILLNGCEANDRMRAAQKVIAKEGVTIRDRHGVIRSHPATVIEKDARIAMYTAFRLLKLEPPSFDDEEDHDD